MAMIYWKQNLGQNFFNFLTGCDLSPSEEEELDLIYLSSHLDDGLFIKMINLLKVSPECLDEYFYAVMVGYPDYNIDTIDLYQLVLDNEDYFCRSKYYYHFSFTAAYALRKAPFDIGHFRRLTQQEKYDILT